MRLPLAAETPPAVPRAVVPDEPLAVSDLRILVVEDNPDAREMLHAVLELEGHHVATAPDAKTALELLELQPFDVALVDIGLPVVDGLEVARRIRAQCRLDHVFLIALTGYDRNEDRHRALKAGFDVHMVKPLDFAMLREVLAEHGGMPL